jgi:hypothetical protein
MSDFVFVDFAAAGVDLWVGALAPTLFAVISRALAPERQGLKALA